MCAPEEGRAVYLGKGLGSISRSELRMREYIWGKKRKCMYRGKEVGSVSGLRRERYISCKKGSVFGGKN